MFAKTSTTSSFLLLISVLSRSIGLSLSGTSKLKSSSANSDSGLLLFPNPSIDTSGKFVVVPGADKALFYSTSPLKDEIGFGPELSPSSSFSSTSSMTDGVRSIAASKR